MMRFYRTCLFILALTGLTIQLVKYGPGMLLYYTILSNLLVTLTLASLLYLMAKGRWDFLESPTWLKFKGGVTVVISLTFVIYHFLLAPQVSHQAYWNLENFLVHYIVPLGFLLDTLWFDRTKIYTRLAPLQWLSFQVLYTCLAFFNGLVTHWRVPGSPDSPFPYFFMNVHRYGWRTVLTGSSFVILIYFLLGYLLIFLKRFMGSKQART